MSSIRKDFQTSPSEVSIFMWWPWHVTINTVGCANLVLLHAAVGAPWWKMSFGFLSEMLQIKPFVMQCVKKWYFALFIPRTVLHKPYIVQALHKRKRVTGFMWKCMDSRHFTANILRLWNGTRFRTIFTVYETQYHHNFYVLGLFCHLVFIASFTWSQNQSHNFLFDNVNTSRNPEQD